MGLSVSKPLWKRIFIRRDPKTIVMVGLKNAGKTTLLEKLKMGKVVNMTLTKGFDVDLAKNSNVHLYVWDIDRQEDRIRDLWKHYFKKTVAIVFVIDSSDENRIEEAKEELSKLTEIPELKDCPVLIFANKQDLPQAMKPTAIFEKLKINENIKFYIQGCNAISSEKELIEGLDWLVDATHL